MELWQHQCPEMIGQGQVSLKCHNRIHPGSVPVSLSNVGSVCHEGLEKINCFYNITMMTCIASSDKQMK